MNPTLKQNLLALPGIGASILPKLACPACWPAYAGLLSSIGLGFLISAAYLLPVTAVSLALAIVTMAYGAKKRYGYGPLLIGLIAGAAVLLGKFAWENKAIVYGAFGLLVIASLWNAWPRRAVPSEVAICSDCTSDKVQ